MDTSLLKNPNLPSSSENSSAWASHRRAAFCSLACGLGVFGAGAAYGLPIALHLALAACTVSYVASLHLVRASLSTQRQERAQELPAEPTANHRLCLTVGDVMTRDVETVPPSLPLWRLYNLFHGRVPASRKQGYPVVDEAGRLVGLVTLADLPDIAWWDTLRWLVVADVMSGSSVHVARPEETAWEVAQRMQHAGIGRLPVVSRDAPQRVIGIVTRTDILPALLTSEADEQTPPPCHEGLPKGKAA